MKIFKPVVFIAVTASIITYIFFMYNEQNNVSRQIDTFIPNIENSIEDNKYPIVLEYSSLSLFEYKNISETHYLLETTYGFSYKESELKEKGKELGSTLVLYDPHYYTRFGGGYLAFSRSDDAVAFFYKENNEK
ncbi:hypothetical protein AGMMS50225_28930 [Betaproteobacteria bacterium]|nr:hypothetical protein AGMMS50225_28930 [Betaproteobacteria bacterium]